MNIEKTAEDYANEGRQLFDTAFTVTKPLQDKLIYDATELATNKERKECVCRLLASGMTAEEVTVILCLRRDEVDGIAKDTDKIAKYAKTLNERKKRHGLT
jgi:hypothetical protein